MTDVLSELDRVVELATLPVVAMEVNRMLADDAISVQEMTRVIEKDQAIVAKILKLVNSSFYGFRSQINNLPHAVVILGFKSLHSAVLSIAVSQVFSKDFKCESFDMADFWFHSVAVALVAQKFAEQTSLCEPEEAFTAGLLHDIGKVILVQYFPEEFRRVWQEQQENGLTSVEAEKIIIDTTHSQIAARVARKWLLPQSLLDVLRCHHDVNLKMESRDLTLLVHGADLVVNTWKRNLVQKPVLKSMDSEAKELLAESLKTMRVWFPPVVKEIQKAHAFFIE
jgi:putative nucleotidyltransferase with HDIG domain